MSYQHSGLTNMLADYQADHDRPPVVIALGATHLKDLQIYFEVKPNGLYFEGIEVIQHNDPIGVLMAGRK